MSKAQIEIQEHIDPPHVSIHFTCPHLRIGQPSIARGSQRDWVLDFLDIHDHYGPKECSGELRRRYQEPTA